MEDSKENVKAEGRGEEADRSSDPARRSDVNSRSVSYTHLTLPTKRIV